METNDLNNFLTEELLNEITKVSFHKRPVDKMVDTHKEHLTSKNHKILAHKSYKDGSHEIIHKTPTKKLRVTTISQAQRRGLVTKITNKPASQKIKQKYSS